MHINWFSHCRVEFTSEMVKGFLPKKAQSPSKLTCMKALTDFRVNFTVWWHAIFMYFLSNFSSLLCIVESLEWQIPAHLHEATPEFMRFFSFPTRRALLRLPGRFLNLQNPFSYSAIFSSYAHWICDMWTCLGVANSIEMPSVWFAALFPIMLNHSLFVLLSTVHH